MEVWKGYLKKVRWIWGFFLLLFATAALVLYLYGISLEPLLYLGCLWCFLCLICFGVDFIRYKKEVESLLHVQRSLRISLGELPPPRDQKERLYQEMIRDQNRSRMQMENHMQTLYGEMTDYYTMWVHQVKTPIAGIRLILQEREEGGELMEQLFRIEEYVEMVLGYLRTEEMASDLRLESCSLDEIIREQIHKFARSFIGKKLSLHYEGVEETVLTDRKWLGFVIGQILSNALKYTSKGGISIYLWEEAPHTLVIQDTGIGIRREDLPRIFEKGFTGCNGREENRSTGIGLYLSAKIMRKLGHTIRVESRQGKGTRLFLGLGREAPELYG